MNEITDTRTMFNESWLSETPENIGSYYIGTAVIDNINTRLAYGHKVIDLNNIRPGFKKLDTMQTLYYWIESDNQISIAAELTKQPQCVIVNMVSKTSARGQPPYAVDLYELILQDQKSQGLGIRLMSDNMISDDGFAVWTRLFQRGHVISIYDSSIPGQSFETIDSLEDLKKFWGSKDLKKYQYILNESRYTWCETQGFFALRRIRELGGAL